jgi:N-acyl-D-aspartate/D-glutamate deacylase
VLDVLISGGLLADGSGAPARRCDVGLRARRVAVVAEPGSVDEPASKTIDATGLVVMPGFVDLHTHYDAQLFWDPTASPSPLHGVTTVIGGNCGFSLAPAGEEHADYLTRMMARVEGMPLAALQSGLDWGWRSFGEWLDRLEGDRRAGGTGVGVNAGFLVGHSALRRAVMGDAAVGSVATPAQRDAMVALAHAAMTEGAFGLSTSQAHTHHDGAGDPVPSRHADRAELEALAAAVADHTGTTLELIVPGCLNGFTEDEIELMGTLSLLAGRPANWNVLGVSAMSPDRTEQQLAASDTVGARGGRLVALTLPHTMKIRLSFETGAILDGLPGWREIFGMSKEARITALRDPDLRRKLDEGARSDEAGILRALTHWGRLEFLETFAPENAGYDGRTVGDVARETGKDPFDAMLDVVVSDGLRTGLRPPIPESEEDWVARAGVWRDPRAVVGGSDAGAHLDVMCGAIYSTSLLGDGVRKRGLLTWEEAAHLLADVPASLYGLRDRGRISEGMWGDVVIIDPETVGHGPERTRDDLPSGASRLFAEADGVEHVLVNGTEVVRHGEFTGALPGRILRSGRDSDTVRVPGVAAA